MFVVLAMEAYYTSTKQYIYIRSKIIKTRMRTIFIKKTKGHDNGSVDYDKDDDKNDDNNKYEKKGEMRR
jgi:hypothetical protein